MGRPRKRAASSTVVPRSTSTSMPLMVSFGIRSSRHQHRLGLADFETRPALDALGSVNRVRGFLLAQDGFRGADVHAGVAAVAERGLDRVSNELLADPGGAGGLPHGGQVFVRGV